MHSHAEADSFCIHCLDEETPWMVSNGEDCASSNLTNTKCNKDTFWESNKYCQQSCSDAGHGYSGDVCCSIPPNPPETSTSFLSDQPNKTSSTTVPTNCTDCTDGETPWRVINGKDCATSNLMDTKCNKDNFWESNKYCQQSCYDAGYGYSGDVCCNVHTHSSQTPLLSSEQPNEESRTNALTTCIECTDEETEWMVDNGEDCASSNLINTKCNKDSSWESNKYCQQSCYHFGYGYGGDACCNTHTHSSQSPLLSPSDQSNEASTCTKCTDEETELMVDNGEDCASSNLIKTKCNKDSSWESNKYCQQSCYHFGYGYSGDVCCNTHTHSPQTTASSLSDQPNEETSTDALTTCIECTDKKTSWMVSNGEDCTSTGFIKGKCKINPLWKRNKYCQQSCYDAGCGYIGDICCSVPTQTPLLSPSDSSNESPSTIANVTCIGCTDEETPTPLLSPLDPSNSTLSNIDNGTCIECTDEESPWMVENVKDCTSSNLIDTRCNKDNRWESNKYCQQSCSDAGYGYIGDFCCSTPPTPPQILASSLSGQPKKAVSEGEKKDWFLRVAFSIVFVLVLLQR